MVVLPPPTDIFIYSRYEIVMFQGGVMIFLLFFDSAGGDGLCKVEIPKDNEQATIMLSCS